MEKHLKYLKIVLYPRVLSNNHINHLVLKARKRLKILKFISEIYWGADAVTLKNTYIAVIRPILEYGYTIYCSANDTNLRKRRSAARIITGFRNSCPRGIVLYEVTLQLLSLRRSVCIV